MPDILSETLPNLDFLENFNKTRPYEVLQRYVKSESNLVCGQVDRQMDMTYPLRSFRHYTRRRLRRVVYFGNVSSKQGLYNRQCSIVHFDTDSEHDIFHITVKLSCYSSTCYSQNFMV